MIIFVLIKQKCHCKKKNKRQFSLSETCFSKFLSQNLIQKSFEFFICVYISHSTWKWFANQVSVQSQEYFKQIHLWEIGNNKRKISLVGDKTAFKIILYFSVILFTLKLYSVFVLGSSLLCKTYKKFAK